MIRNLRLNRKIQMAFLMVIVPLFILFTVLITLVYQENQKYDRVITNATEASRFSITFKEDFDYKVYVLVAYGESPELIKEIDDVIDEGIEITSNLINNTTIDDNRFRAERIQKFLGNLETYVERIRLNKKVGGFYDENYSIWENDIQIVTSLIQSTMAEYTYYETKGINEVRNDVYAQLNQLLVISFVFFAGLIIVALILSIVFPNSIVKPIYYLKDITNQVASGDLSVRAQELSGVEIRQLGMSLNLMIEKINDLVEEVKQDERHIREAELALLQSQINPHFLYNTLDTIVWLAEAGKQEEVVSMVTSFSDFFRTSLSQGSDIVTLGDEFKHVRSYLEIQQVRYQDIMTYDIELPNFLENVGIPKITLQPIVENALYHGVKGVRRSGHISLKALKERDTVIIEIRDNGIGMDNETLQITQKKLTKSNASVELYENNDSYGLYNVNERIRLKFGQGYGLDFESAYEKGTTVRISIPYRVINKAHSIS